MKRLLLSIVLYLALLVPSLAADRYWVGGTGNWSDNTNHWAASSGGAPGASLPTLNDNVFIDQAGPYSITMDTAGATANFTISGSTVTIAAGGNSLAVYGGFSVVGTTIWTGNTIVNLSATTTGHTVTTNGVVFGGNVNFIGSGGGWTLSDALSLTSVRTINVTGGTLNTNAQTVTAGFFVSTSGTRTLTFDNSTFNITGTSGTPWNVTNTGALTATGTGLVINVNGGTAGSSINFVNTSAFSLDTVVMTAPGLWNVTAANVKNFSYTSTTNKTDRLLLGTSMTIAASGSIILAGNSTVNRAFVTASALGGTLFFSVPNTATVTLTNVDFQDITAAGTFGTWTGTSLGDCLGNSGITFDASTTQSTNSVAALWSTATWTSRVPLPQDDVIITSGGTAGTLQTDMPRLGRNIDLSAKSGTVSWSAANTVFGNLTLGGSMSSTFALSLQGRGSHTITNNGRTFPQAVTLAAFGGTYTQQDAFATAQVFSLVNGTWVDQGFGMSSLTAGISGSGARTLDVSGPWALSGGNGTIWSLATATNLTVTSMPSLISFTGLATTTTTFAGGSLTYNNFHWANTATTATLSVSGYNIFRDFKIDGTTARTVTFAIGVVNKTTMGTFTKSNPTPGVLTTINSNSPGLVATLQSMGRQQSLHFLSITDINAVGGAGWFAGNRSTNGGNNYGWQFRPPATIIDMLKHRRSSNDNFPMLSKAA